MTAKSFLKDRAKAVYDTWGKNVPGKIAFFSSEDSYSDGKSAMYSKFPSRDGLWNSSTLRCDIELMKERKSVKFQTVISFIIYRKCRCRCLINVTLPFVTVAFLNNK